MQYVKKADEVMIINHGLDSLHWIDWKTEHRQGNSRVIIEGRKVILLSFVLFFFFQPHGIYILSVQEEAKSLTDKRWVGRGVACLGKEACKVSRSKF